MNDGNPERPRRRFRQEHKPRPVRWWLVALAAVVLLMVLLPRLVALVERSF